MNIHEIMSSIAAPAHICLLILGVINIGIATYDFSKKNKVKGTILISVALLTFACNAVLYLNDIITTIPNLISGTYQEAEYKSGDLGLNIEVISGHGQYVKSQSPLPGESCKKGDTVKLELEEYRSSIEATAAFEAAVGGEYIDIVGQLQETEIKLFDDNLIQTGYFGCDISNVNIVDAYLACEEHGVRYVDYEYANGVISFNHVAKNAEYVLVIKAEGYKDAKFDIDPSWQDVAYMPLDVPYYLALVPEGRSFEMGSTLFFVNENKEFLPGFEFMIEWSSNPLDDGLPTLYAYYTNVAGRVPFLFYVYGDYSIKVSYSSSEGYLFELEDEIIIGKASAGNTLDYYVMVNNDGTMTVLNSSEFWN